MKVNTPEYEFVQRVFAHNIVQTSWVNCPIPSFYFSVEEDQYIHAHCLNWSISCNETALEFSTKVVLMASICFMHCCHTAYISTLVFVYFYKYLYIYPWEARDLDNHYILWWLTESCQCGDFWIIFGLQGSTIGEGHALWSPQPFVRRSQPNCSP